MVSRDLLKIVEKRLERRYSDRLKEFGLSPKTLGWDRVENQHHRFKMSMQATTFEKRSVLDVGCGFGDFYEFLVARGISLNSYTGIDINPQLISICRSRIPQGYFEVRNILIEPYLHEKWDIVTMFGLLNFRFSEFNNESFAQELITEGFRSARKTLVVDMLSDRADGTYPRESFVYYYSPTKMLQFALTLTSNVILLHNYKPLPQKEFMLILGKDNC